MITGASRFSRRLGRVPRIGADESFITKYSGIDITNPEGQPVRVAATPSTMVMVLLGAGIGSALAIGSEKGTGGVMGGAFIGAVASLGLNAFMRLGVQEGF